MSEPLTKSPQDSAIPIGRAVVSAGIGYFGGASTLLLGFAAKVVAVRQSSVLEFGLYSSILSLLTIALSIAQLGLQDGIARMTAASHHDSPVRILKAGLTVSTLFSLGLVFILWVGNDWIASALLHRPDIAIQIRPLWFVLPLWVAANLIAAYMQGMGLVGLRGLLVDVTRLGAFCLFVVVLSKALSLPPLQTLIFALMGGVAISFLVTCIYVALHPKRSANLEQDESAVLADLLRHSMPLLVANLITLVVTSGNVLALSVLASSRDAAIYSVVLAIGQLIGLGGTALDLVLLPMFTALSTTNRQRDLEALYWTMTRWSLLIISPMALIAINFPEQILQLLFGSNYLDGANALRFVGMCFFLHTAVGPNEAALKTMRSTSRLLVVRLLTVVWMVCVGWLAAARWGYLGMFAGWGSGLILYNAMLGLLLKQAKLLTKIPNSLIVTFFVCLAALLIPLGLMSLPFMWKVLASATIYIALLIGAYWRFSGLYSEDRAYLQQVIARVSAHMRKRRNA
jgi:O-antigen/teichoic acid export membrane protein